MMINSDAILIIAICKSCVAGVLLLKTGLRFRQRMVSLDTIYWRYFWMAVVRKQFEEIN